MGLVLRDHAPAIRKGDLRDPEGDAVLVLILLILPWIPIEACLRHCRSLAVIWLSSHIYVWTARNPGKIPASQIEVRIKNSNYQKVAP